MVVSHLPSLSGVSPTTTVAMQIVVKGLKDRYPIPTNPVIWRETVVEKWMGCSPTYFHTGTKSPTGTERQVSRDPRPGRHVTQPDNLWTPDPPPSPIYTQTRFTFRDGICTEGAGDPPPTTHLLPDSTRDHLHPRCGLLVRDGGGPLSDVPTPEGDDRSRNRTVVLVCLTPGVGQWGRGLGSWTGHYPGVLWKTGPWVPGYCWKCP